MSKEAHNFIDMTGQKFGRLAIIKRAKNRGKQVVWRCLCECGNEVYCLRGNLICGRTKSCGCLNNEMRGKGSITHDMSGTVEYNTWTKMKGRCNRPADKSYKNYGGRGINVCNRWLKFENFFADMGRKPPGKTLERTNNERGYSPDNCVWATFSEQSVNTRQNVFITFKGQRKTISQWSNELNIPYGRLRDRIQDEGWSHDRALTTPIRKGNYRRKKLRDN